MRELTCTERDLALRFCSVRLPEDAIDCEPWEWHADAWRRLFTVREWRIGAILVAVAGEQTHDGVVIRWVYLGGEEQLTGSERLRLAEVLIDAGKLVGSLN
jgi:hypothetical protein